MGRRAQGTAAALVALLVGCTGAGTGPPRTGSGGAPSNSTGGASSSTGGAGGVTGCSFSLISAVISPGMATVGLIDWSTTLATLTSARIVWTLDGGDATVLNAGGAAPVDLTKPRFRTALLGLKPASDYTFHIEATDANHVTCASPDYTLPTTGTYPYAPAIARTATNPAAQARGFIVTSSGVTYGNFAIILDADGAVVWYAEAPIQCTRARMDYEGVNMWMVQANEDNSGGEMRMVSMDGLTAKHDVSGLGDAHHDFAVLPGKIAAMEWTTTDIDAESELVEMNSDGSGAPNKVFKIGSNLYAGRPSASSPPTTTYHANSILYHLADDTFTIGDRYPNLYVKVSRAGAVQWQFGGSCADAPAGAAHCIPETWQVNHGHHLLDDGTMLVFNNNLNGRPSDVLEFNLATMTAPLSATSVEDYQSGNNSNVLGDVQRLPNGNTLITYSTDGTILEVDPSWAPVQTITGAYGYSDWRETLYGPPAR